MSRFNLRDVRVLPITLIGYLPLLLFTCSPLIVRADSTSSKILCRPELSSTRRHELAVRLRQITGWSGLDFGEHGELMFGGVRPKGGSETARALLAKAAARNQLLVIEDASNEADVIFSRVVEGRWTTQRAVNPATYILQIDFVDFSRVRGDRDALAAFNAGWGVLHEVAHVVNNSVDAKRAGEAGECEDLINAMRRECGLAERAEYHFNFLPGVERAQFKTKFVRLGFDRYEPMTNRKRRLWLVWDADLVGGLDRKQH